jgi:hypothetical protein
MNLLEARMIGRQRVAEELARHETVATSRRRHRSRAGVARTRWSDVWSRALELGMRSRRRATPRATRHARQL